MSNKVYYGGFDVQTFIVQLRLALSVNVGPTSASNAPTSTWSAVGELNVVVVALMPSLTSALTVADAVFTVRHPPALPLHCALAWLTLMADPSTIAARRKRVAFIEFAPKFTGVSTALGWNSRLSLSTDKTRSPTRSQREKTRQIGSRMLILSACRFYT